MPILESLTLPITDNGQVTSVKYDIPQGTVTEADLEEAEGTKADAIVRSASGSIASYDDGGDLPMKSLKVNIVPKQEGTGDPSPQNIRPISGTDEVEIYHSGADTSNYETIAKTLPQTVYGGTLDVVSGKGDDNRGTLDLGSLSWTKSNNIFYASIADKGMKLPPDNTTAPNIVCDRYKTVAYTERTEDTISSTWESSTNKYIYVTDSAYADADAFKTAMNGVIIIFEKATPTEIDLTPTEVKSLLGDNNVWSDSGTVEVEYRADTSLVINKILEALA